MGDPLRAIGAVVTVGAGIALFKLNPFWGAELVGLGLAMAGTRIAKPGEDAGAQQEVALRNAASTRAEVPIVYGETKIGGLLFFDRVDPSINDRRDRYRGFVFSLAGEGGQGIEGVQQVFFDNVQAVSPVTENNTTTGIISGVQAPWDGTRDSIQLLRYNAHTGADAQTHDAMLNDIFPSVWNTSHDGRGLAHMSFKMHYEKEVWAQGAPAVTALVRGVKVYDPRTDEWLWDVADSMTHGPSDPHPGENPVLQVLDYLTSKRYGLGANYPERDADGSVSEIDEQSFIDAANYCDDQVSINIPTPTVKTRFVSGGHLFPGRDKEANLEAILSACRGRLTYTGGKWRIFILSASETATGFKLDESNTVGEWEWFLGGISGAPNQIVANFVNPTLNWQGADTIWPEVGTTTLLDNDGGFRSTTRLSLPFSKGETQAKQIAQVSLRELRQNLTILVTADASATQVERGDLIEVSNESAGFTDKEMWVDAWTLNPDFTVNLVLREYDALVYSLDDQASPEGTTSTDLPDPTSIAPPTLLTLTSDATTAIETEAGKFLPAIKATWTAPSDPFLAKFVVRYKLTTESDWKKFPDPDPTDLTAIITPVTEGKTYDVEVFAENTLGIRSAADADTIQAATKAELIVLLQSGEYVQWDPNTQRWNYGIRFLTTASMQSVLIEYKDELGATLERYNLNVTGGSSVYHVIQDALLDAIDPSGTDKDLNPFDPDLINYTIEITGYDGTNGNQGSGAAGPTVSWTIGEANQVGELSEPNNANAVLIALDSGGNLSWDEAEFLVDRTQPAAAGFLKHPTPGAGPDTATFEALVDGDLPIVSRAKGGTGADNSGTLARGELLVAQGAGPTTFTRLAHAGVPADEGKVLAVNALGDLEWTADATGIPNPAFDALLGYNNTEGVQEFKTLGNGIQVTASAVELVAGVGIDLTTNLAVDTNIIPRKNVAESITSQWTFDAGLKTDTISEDTLNAGVTADGVLLKDSQVNTDVINELGLNAGVTVDGVLLKDFQVSTDVINELSAGVGVTVDGVLLKDGVVGSNYGGTGLTNAQISADSVLASTDGTSWASLQATVDDTVLSLVSGNLSWRAISEVPGNPGAGRFILGWDVGGTNAEWMTLGDGLTSTDGVPGDVKVDIYSAGSNGFIFTSNQLDIDKGVLFAGTAWNSAVDGRIALADLADLGDTNIVTPSDNQYLRWEDTPGEWVNSTIDAGHIGSGTLASARLTGSYTGITGVGTIGTGTWEGTDVGVAHGGTGLSAIAIGSLLWANTANNLAPLGPGSVGDYLTVSATNVLGWAEVNALPADPGVDSFLAFDFGVGSEWGTFGDGITYTGSAIQADLDSKYMIFTSNKIDISPANLAADIDLDDLQNTVITAVGAGEILVRSGANWINNTLAEAGIAADTHTHVAADVTDFSAAADARIAAAVLNDLSDAVITTPSDNQYLRYESTGADWVNSTIDAGHLGSGTLLDARVAVSNVTQHEGSITHNNLTGVVANEHIDHSGVSVIAGAGMTGGGAITANVTLNVIGVADRITVAADSVDIASTYVGQTSITTLGTVGTGTWQGTAVGSNYGGTGLTNAGLTSGDILWSQDGTSIGVIGIGAVGEVLTVTATNTADWSAANTLSTGTAAPGALADGEWYGRYT